MRNEYIDDMPDQIPRLSVWEMGAADECEPEQPLVRLVGLRRWMKARRDARWIIHHAPAAAVILGSAESLVKFTHQAPPALAAARMGRRSGV